MNDRDRLSEVYSAALTVFSTFGYKKSTVEEIAAELGLTKGALYQYAINKRDLYEHTVKFGLMNWQNKVFDAVRDEPDVKKQFKDMCIKGFVYLSEDTRLKSVLIKDPSMFPMSFISDPFRDVNNASMDFIKNIIDRGISENKFRKMDAAFVTRFLFSIYKMLIIETYVLEEQDSNIESVIDIITQGFFCSK